jgi:hypothetical protein
MEPNHEQLQDAVSRMPARALREVDAWRSLFARVHRAEEISELGRHAGYGRSVDHEPRRRLLSSFEKWLVGRVICLTALCLAYSLGPVFWYRFVTARMATLNRLSVSRATVAKARGTTTTLSLSP